MYNREQRWKQEFEINGVVKTYYPKDEATMKKNLAVAKEKGYRKISSKKLYPFSTNKNQHNFELISNICFNRIHDICIMGENEEYEGELDKLETLKEKADKYFCYSLPVAWVTWEEYCEMKELAEMAIFHRQEACIEAGRPDLVMYC